MSNITLDTKVYTGLGYRGDGASWQNRDAGVVSGFKNIDTSINYTKDKTNVRAKITTPVVSTEASSCACPGEVLRNRYIDIVVRYDKMATQADRDSALQDIKDLVLTTQFSDLVKNLTIAV